MNTPPNRVNDLYAVNTTAGWAKSQLSILSDMTKGKVPDWITDEIDRIQCGIATVHGLERARKDRKNGNS